MRRIKDFLIAYRWFILLAMFGMFMLFGCAGTTVPTADAGVLDASWTEPTTNTDGTPLTDLASYKVYVTKAPGVPCPGGTFITVPAVKPAPSANSRVSTHLTGLTVGSNYVVSVTAVNVDAQESGCSPTANANARPSTPATGSGLTVQ